MVVRWCCQPGFRSSQVQTLLLLKLSLTLIRSSTHFWPGHCGEWDALIGWAWVSLLWIMQVKNWGESGSLEEEEKIHALDKKGCLLQRPHLDDLGLWTAPANLALEKLPHLSIPKDGGGYRLVGTSCKPPTTQQAQGCFGSRLMRHGAFANPSPERL